MGRVTSSRVRIRVVIVFECANEARIAIRFVLSDAYTDMAKEERQALLHEGVSVAQTMSAYSTHSPSYS